MTLDEWSNDEIDAMIEIGGNASANSIYEAYFPEGISKPGPDAGHEERSKFIRLDEMQSYFVFMQFIFCTFGSSFSGYLCNSTCFVGLSMISKPSSNLACVSRQIRIKRVFSNQVYPESSWILFAVQVQQNR